MGKIIQFPAENTEDTIAEEMHKDYNDYTKEEIDKMYEDFYTDATELEEFYNTPYVMENQ